MHGVKCCLPLRSPTVMTMRFQSIKVPSPTAIATETLTQSGMKRVLVSSLAQYSFRLVVSSALNFAPAAAGGGLRPKPSTCRYACFAWPLDPLDRTVVVNPIGDFAGERCYCGVCVRVVQLAGLERGTDPLPDLLRTNLRRALGAGAENRLRRPARLYESPGVLESGMVRLSA